MIKLPFVLFAVGLSIFASSACLAKDDLESLDQRIVELFEQGKYQEAIPLAEKAVKMARRLRGPEDPDIATSLNNLAVLYQAMGEYAKAEPLFRERSGSGRRSWALNIPTRRRASITWPCCTRRWARTPKPNRSYRKRSGSGRRSRPRTSRHGHSVNNLAELYQAMGEYAKAEPLLQEALPIQQKILRPEHPDTAPRPQ